jgi:hypothetical protein
MVNDEHAMEAVGLHQAQGKPESGVWLDNEESPPL